MQAPFIDFHCHPALKPFGQSFSNNPVGRASADRGLKWSIWHRDPPNLFDKGMQAWAGICKFSQADCSTLSAGNSRIVCASLYPVERGFFRNKLGDNNRNEIANAYVTSVGRERVNAITRMRNYFEDLTREYDFYRQMSGKPMKIDGGEATYWLVNSWADIDRWRKEPGGDRTIFFIMTIEGLHALYADIDAPPDKALLLKNLRAIKAWEHPPFFVTFAHHFNNYLCGHSKSLFDVMEKLCDQKEAILTGFTPLGKEVLREVLSRDNGRRIHIDIKHMSPLARKEYFAILATEYAGEQIPIIASHAAANGLRSMDEPITDNPALAPKLLAEGINFYDNEIIAIAKSGGIYGLQLDERRLASAAALKGVKHSADINLVRQYRSELLWNQVQYVAELLDKIGIGAWDCLAIGSDFDATIDPLNGFLTAAQLPDLQKHLEQHAANYMAGAGKKLKPFNQIPAIQIVSRIFSDNGRRFLERWFR